MELSSKPITKEADCFSMKKKQNKLTTTAVVMCALGAIFYCYEYYLRVAPSVMREELKGAFLLNEASFGYLAFSCYYFAYIIMQIPVGTMTDRFGPRRILTFACFLCAFGTYLFATTSQVWVAEIGRFLVGFGSAFAYVGALKLSNIWLPRKYFAFMAGFCTALGMLGAMSGSITMSYLVGLMGWRPTLYYSVIIGFVLMLILWLVLRDTNKGVNIANSPSYKTAEIEEAVHQQFECLKEIMKSPQMWITGMIGCLTFLPISGFAEAWAPSFLETVGMSKRDAANGTSMMFLGFALGGPIWGIISDKIKSRRFPLMVGSFISASLMAWLILFPSTSQSEMYCLLFLCAFFASAEILIFAVSDDLSHSAVNATAVAFINMITMVGGFVLPWLIGKLLDNSLQLVDDTPSLTTQDYSSALAVLPAALLLAGVLSCILKESYRRHY